jgi:hypothetical protein
VAQELVDRVLPGPWQPLAGAPAQLYGSLALLWEVEGGDLLFLPGLELRFFPGRRVQPAVWLEFLQPEGGSQVDQDFKAVFGVVGHLGKERP